MKSKQLLRAGIMVAALATADAGAAFAQVTTTPQAASAEEAPDTATIIVTGSRIRTNPLNQTSPVVTVDQAALKQTGLSAIADVLQRLPSASGGLNSKVNNSGNIGNPSDGGGVGAGSAEIDLRYLGAKRTLVLVDGMRFVSGASASGIPSTVDLNSFPAEMIDKIEILQSGQSPLYGTDALSGVVNIITKASQEGLHGSAQFGTFRQGDGHTQDYSLSYGVKSDRVSVVFGGSYVKQDKVSTADRKLSQFPNPGQTACSNGGGGCSSATVNGFIDLGTAQGPITVRSPVIGRAPVYDPTLVGGDFRSLVTSDRFNFSPYNYFLTPSERYGGFVSVKAELTDHINWRGKFVYNRRNSQNQAAFLPLFVGPDAGNGNLLDTISIDATNPYNPFGFTLNSGTNGQPATYSTVRRRLVEAGQRTYTQRVDTMQFTGGLDGSFMLGDKEWFWDANAAFGFNDAHQTFTGNINAAKLAQALGPVANCTGACVPFNIFGGVGSVTPAMLAFVGFDEHDKSSQQLQDYTLNITGDLFDLPAGPVGVAFGYEHRYQFGSFTPDPYITAGLGADIPAQPAAGKYNSDEVYAELRVPLLKEKPFFYALDVDGAVRHSSYSTAGSNTTFTGTANWKPVEDVLFRGSWAQGFRAPSLGELFGAASRSDAPIDDPCTNVAGSPFATSATVRANCIANGVPADGSYQEPNGGQLPVLTGGNKALKPEKSRTLLFGAVYSPRWARDNGFASQLSFEVNYYDIKVRDAIAPIDASITLARCAELGDTTSCNSVIRTANGLVSRINGLLQNIGGIRTKGIDFTANYRSPDTSVGTFGVSLNGNVLLKYAETLPAASGFQTTSYKGKTRGFPDQSYPKLKATGILSWGLDDFGALFTGRYIAAVHEFTGQKLNSRLYGDVQLTYTPSALDQKFGFTVGVNNVFNSGPPPCFSCTGPNYDPTTYDVPGQFGYVRVTYKM